MREEMTNQRIGNWACPYCGTRIKKKAIVKNAMGNEIGYALICCNCGHVEKFAANEDGISLFVGSVSGVAKTMSMGCAKGVKVECEFKEHCPYNPSNIKPPTKPEEKPSVPSPFDGLAKVYD